MTILSAQSIERLCIEYGMLSPFADRTRHEGVTFGLSAAGYDVRIEFDRDGSKTEHLLSPGEFMLASTIERFRMPSKFRCMDAQWRRWRATFSLWRGSLP